MKTKLKLVITLLMLTFICMVVLSSLHTFKQRYANESFDELDIYSMHEFSRVNSKKALQAIKEGDSAKLEELMVSSEGMESVMNFAEWSSMDIENAVSMGSGSLSTDTNKKGEIDVSERFVVETSDSKYVFFIETLTSRWGRKNDGVSAIGVTSFEHFDDIDYNWSGDLGEGTALAGKLFWKENQ